MRNTFLPFAPPSIGEDEVGEVLDTLRSDWITTGPKVARFEQEFAGFIGAPAALAINSGTAALHLALAALDIGPGDQVISTPLTFCSSIHVIEHVGARPVLVDVEPDTLNIDPARVDETLGRGSGRFKAILPVHLYGHPCEMDPLLALAQQYGLALVEDAAHALPARYRGRTIGAPPPAPNQSVPDLTAFSFYATKNLTTAEGGMLTGDPELLDRARVLSLHGMSRDAYKRYTAEGGWHYDVVAAGFKYNMTDIQGALGLQQLRRLPDFQSRRAAIARRYDRAFQHVEELELPARRANIEHAWHLYVIRLRLDRLNIDRARFIEELKAQKIGTSVHFIPVHMHTYYKEKYGFKPEDYPVALQAYQRMISLPLYPRMTDADVDDVVEAVTEIVNRHRR
jgi:dTDP-4-amino-4,6-dideoxygalactose transaminase